VGNGTSLSTVGLGGPVTSAASAADSIGAAFGPFAVLGAFLKLQYLLQNLQRVFKSHYTCIDWSYVHTKHNPAFRPFSERAHCS